MKKVTSRKALQALICISATAPLLSGIAGLSGIYNPLFFDNLPVNLILDSNLRFLNALSVGIALSFYFIIPVIEQETFACRVICCAIFLGGVGRLISIYALGIPPLALLGFLAMELVFPVVIIYWQRLIASNVTK